MKNKRLKTKNRIEVGIDINENSNLKKEPKTIPNAKNITIGITGNFIGFKFCV
jgi:hypothetical protein